jgi:hypothetical protein
MAAPFPWWTRIVGLILSGLQTWQGVGLTEGTAMGWVGALMVKNVGYVTDFWKLSGGLGSHWALFGPPLSVALYKCNKKNWGVSKKKIEAASRTWLRNHARTRHHSVAEGEAEGATGQRGSDGDGSTTLRMDENGTDIFRLYSRPNLFTGFKSVRIRVRIFNIRYRIRIQILKSHIYDVDIQSYHIRYS